MRYEPQKCPFLSHNFVENVYRKFKLMDKEKLQMRQDKVIGPIENTITTLMGVIMGIKAEYPSKILEQVCTTVEIRDIISTPCHFGGNLDNGNIWDKNEVLGSFSYIKEKPDVVLDPMTFEHWYQGHIYQKQSFRIPNNSIYPIMNTFSKVDFTWNT